MFSYLFTQLYLATMMSEVGKALWENYDLFEAFPVSSTVLAQITSADPVLAPSIRETRSSAPSTPPSRPTPIQRDAAIDVIVRPLSEVNDPESVNVWARAQAVLDNWKPAVAAYSKLLAMRKTPDILVEAARVFASAKDFNRARDLLQEALGSLSEADPPARARITFDAAHLALYEPPPDGYKQALKLLSPDIVGKDTDGGMHVLRACANGQRYGHEQANLPDQDKLALRSSVLSDLRAAMRSPKHRDWILYLLGRNPDGGVRSPAPDVEDDDLFPFKDEKEFLDLVGVKP